MEDIELDYMLLKPLYQAFDDADSVLKGAVDKLKSASEATANVYFTGLVGLTYHQRVEELCTRLQAFRKQLGTYHEEVGRAEAAFKQGDSAAAQELNVPD